jgi:HD-like signal output (HDOD) protein
MMEARKVDAIIQRIEKIPTLPIVCQKAMELMADEHSTLKQIGSLIEQDQSLMVKLLRITNSAFYGLLNRVNTVEHALVILGIEEVRKLILGMSIYNFFSDDKGSTMDRTRLWKHAIVCSQVAKFLGKYFKAGDDDSLFLAGLVHDVGKIIFDQYFHEAFLDIIDNVSSRHLTFSKAEKAILGTTHYHVAAKLFQQWKFPKNIIFQVFYHHAPWHDQSYETGSTIIYLANILTKIVGYPCHPEEQQIDVDAFVNSQEMQFINKSGFQLEATEFKNLTHKIEEYLESESDNVLKLFEE